MLGYANTSSILDQTIPINDDDFLLPATPAKKKSRRVSLSSPTTPTKRASLSSPPTPTKRRKLVHDLPGLDDYISLGVFRVEIFSSAYQEDEVWSEALRLEEIKEVVESHPALIALYAANWVRCECRRACLGDANTLLIRIYLLPDDIAKSIVLRENYKLRRALRAVLQQLHTSATNWDGLETCSPEKWYSTMHEDAPESLFYVFNTLPSPAPDADVVDEDYSRLAVETLLNDDLSTIGLKAQLYNYQRRSAAMMVQRESQPVLTRDVRYRQCTDAQARKYFIDDHSTKVVRDCPSYEEACGGILAETMGYGKTLICLTTILATKDHLPRITAEYLASHVKDDEERSSCKSLAAMVAIEMNRTNFPWKAHFARQTKAGFDYTPILEHLYRHAGWYMVPEREHRTRGTRKEHKILLSSTTLIVVPRNLLNQWEDEIERHVQPDAMSYFILKDSSIETLPAAEELCKYDVILMDKQTYSRQLDPGRETRSPLLDVHFLRLIVDEGHHLVSSGSLGGDIYDLQSIRVERRWVVSGTPIGTLIGAEVDLAANADDVDPEAVRNDTKDILAARRHEISQTQENADIVKLGQIVCNFLKVQPWSNGEVVGDTASWNKYMVASHSNPRPFARLKQFLSGLLVRHQIQDIETEIALPPLHNKVTYLDPCYFDKLSINLFIQSLTVNAVSSERTDQDYMFHLRNREYLKALVRNLRASGFCWVGFSPEDVSTTIKHSKSYVEKHLDTISARDKRLLHAADEAGQEALDSLLWNAMHHTSELGLVISRFPECSKRSWSLLSDQNENHPLVLGLSALGHVQKSLKEGVFWTLEKDVFNGIGWNHKSMGQKSSTGLEVETPSENLSALKNLPSSCVQKSKLRTPHVGYSQRSSHRSISSQQIICPSPLEEAPIYRPLCDELRPLRTAKLVGTISAKLTYLIEQISKYAPHEKILIFYEADHIAYYIAQVLDALSIKYFIYATGLSVKLREDYLRQFNQPCLERVMLMDLSQASQGLHVASASRVYFVNPVWQPNIEAQAVKRAHRIGQTRPVHVETLVLRDTLEHQMLMRRRAMSAPEHQKASGSLLDDKKIVELIKNARFVKITEEEKCDGWRQVALLECPKLVFASGESETEMGGKEEREDWTLPQRESPQEPLAKTNTPKKKSSVKFTETPVKSLDEILDGQAQNLPPGSTTPSRKAVKFAETPVNPLDQILAESSAPEAMKPTKKASVRFADDSTNVIDSLMNNHDEGPAQTNPKQKKSVRFS